MIGWKESNLGIYHATIFVELESDSIIKARQKLAEIIQKDSNVVAEHAIITMAASKDQRGYSGDPWMDETDFAKAKLIRESQNVKYTFYNPETDESKERRHREVVARREEKVKDIQFSQVAEFVGGKIVFSKKE